MSCGRREQYFLVSDPFILFLLYHCYKNGHCYMIPMTFVYFHVNFECIACFTLRLALYNQSLQEDFRLLFSAHYLVERQQFSEGGGEDLSFHQISMSNYVDEDIFIWTS